jgi:hypothetical protein
MCQITERFFFRGKCSWLVIWHIFLRTVKLSEIKSYLARPKIGYLREKQENDIQKKTLKEDVKNCRK